MTPRNSLLVMALLLLAVLSLGLLWMPGDTIGIETDPEGTEESSAEVDFALNEGLISGKETTEANRASSENRTDATAERRGIKTNRQARVQVLNQDSWVAAANTTIYYLTKDHKEAHPAELKNFAVRNPWGSAGLDALQQVVTDEEGIATLQFTGNIVWMYAKVGEARGRKALKLRSDPNGDLRELHTFYIQPVEVFTVHVLEVGGEAAAGVPVRLRQTFRNSPGAEMGELGITNADGIATLDVRKSIFAGDYVGVGNEGNGKGIEAMVALPFLGAAAEKIAHVREGGRETTIYLPEHGGVELHIQNQPNESHFYLKCEPRGKGSWRYMNSSLQVEAGLWRDEFLALDQEIQVGMSSTYLKNRKSVSPQVIWSGKGPRRKGEMVQIQLNMHDGLFLTGRLLHADGSVLGKAQIDLTLVDAGGRPVGEVYHQLANDQGVFRVYLDKHEQDFARVEQVWIRSIFGRSNGRELEIDTLDYASHVTLGVSGTGVDLGTLHPLSSGLMVSGKVVDASGAPISFATVQVEKEIRGSESLKQSANPPLDVQDPLSARTDLNGEFRIHQAEVPVDLQYVVRAEAKNHSRTWQRFEAGQEGITLVMQRLGSLSYSLESNLFDRQSISIRIKNHDESNFPKVHESSHFLYPNGEVKAFLKEDMEAGIYHWEARSSKGELLAEFDGVEVNPGGTTKDPRLQNIILEDATETISVSMIDEAGVAINSSSAATLETMRVFLSGAPGTQSLQFVKLHGDKATFKAVDPNRGSAYLLTVGYEAISLQDVHDGDVITLRRIPTLQIQVHGRVSLPEGWSFELQFEPMDENRNYQAFALGRGRAEKIGENQYSVQLPGPGLYGLTWRSELNGDFFDADEVAEIFISRQDLKDGISTEIPQSFVQRVQARAERMRD